MFIRSNLPVPKRPQELGYLNLISSVFSLGGQLYGAYTSKSIATKNRRLERAIASEQLALQQKAMDIEYGYQEKVLAMEEERTKAWIASELIKAQAIASAPSMNTAGAVRVDPTLIQEVSIAGAGGGYYYTLPEEKPVEEPSLAVRLGLPDEIAGIKTEYLIGGGILSLLLI